MAAHGAPVRHERRRRAPRRQGKGEWQARCAAPIVRVPHAHSSNTYAAGAAARAGCAAAAWRQPGGSLNQNSFTQPCCGQKGQCAPGARARGRPRALLRPLSQAVACAVLKLAPWLCRVQWRRCARLAVPGLDGARRTGRDILVVPAASAPAIRAARRRRGVRPLFSAARTARLPTCPPRPHAQQHLNCARAAKPKPPV